MKTKICSKCNIEKELVGFSLDRKSLDGLQSKCKVCVKQPKIDNKTRITEYNKQHRFCKICRTPKSLDNFYDTKDGKSHICKTCGESKFCKLCGEWKLLSEFSAKKYSKDGVQNICKLCTSRQYEEFCIKNKSRVNARIAEYHRQHKSIRCGWGKPNPINIQFLGAHLHHLHIDGDHQICIYIPATLHRSIRHAHDNSESMIKINLACLKWYYGLTIAGI